MRSTCPESAVSLVAGRLGFRERMGRRARATLRWGVSCVALLGWSASVAAMSFLPGCVVRDARDSTNAGEAQASTLLADKVLVKKSQRRLYLMRDGEPFRTYRIALGSSPEGHKQREGDGRTPEGHYRIDWRNANSRFTKALHISYPNRQDRLRASSRGWSPGGAIMIHGEPRRALDPALRDLVRYEDWTEGCIAVSNLAVDEIWRYTPDGIPIEIRP
jgi:murein L,D-transpeptidase YafK